MSGEKPFGPPDFAPGDIAQGKKLFTTEVEFARGASAPKDFPKAPLPEIAFAGRSNVGKSSLVNAMTQRKLLARTSNTPGRTREINFFLINKKFHLVDLPGYGFALASKGTVEKFQTLTIDYLKDRFQLKRVFILIDSRHGLKEIDREMMSMLDEAEKQFQIVLTKADKINDLEHLMGDLEVEMQMHPFCFPRILLTSSRKLKGLEFLRAEIVGLLRGK